MMYIINMKIFIDRLKYLMSENRFTNETLSNKLGVSIGTIKSWKVSQSVPILNTAIKLANLFECSLDYLFGKIDIEKYDNYVNPPPFHIQLRRLIEEKNISQYNLITNKICSPANLTRWLKYQTSPNMSNVIKLADYFNLSLDEFVGRV